MDTAHATPPATSPAISPAISPAAAELGPVITRRIADLDVFKIKDTDSNYFAMIADPIRDKVPFSIFLEVFEPNGKTPWHHHGHAHEMFFVLSGRGKSICEGQEIEVGPGESFIVRPGFDHEVINTGPDKLYCLTVMIPNEGFAELVRSGFKVPLQADDIAAITGVAQKTG